MQEPGATIIETTELIKFIGGALAPRDFEIEVDFFWLVSFLSLSLVLLARSNKSVNVDRPAHFIIYACDLDNMLVIFGWWGRVWGPLKAGLGLCSADPTVPTLFAIGLRSSSEGALGSPSGPLQEGRLRRPDRHFSL